MLKDLKVSLDVSSLFYKDAFGVLRPACVIGAVNIEDGEGDVVKYPIELSGKVGPPQQYPRGPFSWKTQEPYRKILQPVKTTE